MDEGVGGLHVVEGRADVGVEDDGVGEDGGEVGEGLASRRAEDVVLFSTTMRDPTLDDEAVDASEEAPFPREDHVAAPHVPRHGEGLARLGSVE